MADYINTLAQYRMSDDWDGHIARGSRGGIDYAVGMNTPIPAPGAGRLENRPDNGNGFGNYIRFHHGNGFIDEYLHLRDGGFVAEGNYSQGQIIGYSGSTGNSTGPHVHWHLIDPSGTRVDPLKYVQGGAVTAPAPSGISASMAAAQQILANVGLYTGPIDGVFGPKSWRAAQTWLTKYNLYDGRIDGIPGPKTYAGVQQYAKKNDNYRGPLDGILGPLSWAGFVQSLKEDTAVAAAPVTPPKPPVVTPPVQQHENPKPPAKPVTKPVTKPVSKPIVKPVEPAKPSKPVRPVKIKDVQPVFAAIPTQKGVIVRGGLFGVVRSLAFWNDTLTRAFNTFLQVALAAVGTGAVGVTDIDYIGILNLAAGGAIVSVLTSFVRATTPKK